MLGHVGAGAKWDPQHRQHAVSKWALGVIANGYILGSQRANRGCPGPLARTPENHEFAKTLGFGGGLGGNGLAQTRPGRHTIHFGLGIPPNLDFGIDS